MPAHHDILIFKCPCCKIEMEAPAHAAGHPAQCPFCGTGFLVPSIDGETFLHSAASSGSGRGMGSGIRRRKPRRRGPPRTHSRPRSIAAPARRRRRRQSVQPVVMIPPVVKRPQNQKKFEITMAVLCVLGTVSFGWAMATRTEPSPAMQQIQPPPAPTSTPRLTAASPASAQTQREASWPTQRVRRGDGREILAGMSTGEAHPLPRGTWRSGNLLDARGRHNRAWVQELDPRSGQVQWQANFGGDLIRPTHLIILRNGGIVIGGQAGRRLPSLSFPGASGVSPDGPVLVKISDDGADVHWVHAAGEAGRRINSIHQDREGRLVWTTVREGGAGAPMLHRLSPDGTPLASLSRF